MRRASDDGDRDDAPLLEHRASDGIALTDGTEETAENCLLLDGETGRFECGPGVLALAADNVGYSNLFGSLGDRVGDGVASVQNRSFSCLLGDDLARPYRRTLQWALRRGRAPR